jgi:repressor of nif and glnA expression
MTSLLIAGTGRFGGNMTKQRNIGDMSREDRMKQVLQILTEADHALPAAVIWRNARLRGATFERRTVNRYLSELVDEGYLKKVDPKALQQGRLVEIGTDKQGYFIATDRATDFPD